MHRLILHVYSWDFAISRQVDSTWFLTSLCCTEYVTRSWVPLVIVSAFTNEFLRSSCRSFSCLHPVLGVSLTTWTLDIVSLVGGQQAISCGFFFMLTTGIVLLVSWSESPGTKSTDPAIARIFILLRIEAWWEHFLDLVLSMITAVHFFCNGQVYFRLLLVDFALQRFTDFDWHPHLFVPKIFVAFMTREWALVSCVRNLSVILGETPTSNLHRLWYGVLSCHWISLRHKISSSNQRWAYLWGVVWYRNFGHVVIRNGVVFRAFLGGSGTDVRH